MSKPNEYVLKVGSQAADRLRILDEIYGPYTREFLTKIGLSSNLQVLEVGCGTGNTTCWIAEQLGDQGRIIGVDISSEQIEVAKQQAHARKIKNVEFKALSIFDLHELTTQFDLVFSRFLLQHVGEPAKALQKMYERVKPQGILACDEQNLAAARSYPHSKAFNDAVELAYKIARNKGLDYDIGLRLYTEFKKLNLKDIQVQTIQPVLLKESQKMIWPMFMQEAEDAFLSSHEITKIEWDKMLKELKENTRSESYYFLPMQNFQVCGIK